MGPTASGKTGAALLAARAVGGEIISADSMQIYQKMNIGTAKPTQREMESVTHHMIDIVSPRAGYSAAEYARDAVRAIDSVIAKGRHPIVCGGTGLYIDALIYPTEYEDSSRDQALRDELSLLDCHTLWLMLRDIDPEESEKVHENNKKRVIRAIEIYKTTGQKKSSLDKRQKSHSGKYDALLLMPEVSDRQALYQRIDQRVDEMIASGLEGEIRELLASGELVPGTTAYQAIGYKELISYIKGEESLDSATARLKQATRNYAKRQLTWFSRYPYKTFKSPQEAADMVKAFVNS